ncbi:MAG TPA: nuclear transport factor 2 family protein [Xanthomonadaceae bacterium]|jgi:predicted SnoaL-like aldol condensation-catalyzing enzyme
MTSSKWIIAALALAIALPLAAHAQVAVEASKDQEALLKSSDPHLAANKRLVYDFWRSVLEGGHLELADKYLAEGYIQHNPSVPTGRAGFVKFFSAFAKPSPIDAHIKAPLVSIVAERDLVVLSFVQQLHDPKDAKKTYTTTGFDMFRVENGRIAEHWDAETK